MATEIAGSNEIEEDLAQLPENGSNEEFADPESSNTEEIAQPQDNGGVVSADDITDMTDEDFSEYIDKLRSGMEDEPAAIEPDNTKPEPEAAETSEPNPDTGTDAEKSAAFKTFASQQELEDYMKPLIDEAVNNAMRSRLNKDELKELEEFRAMKPKIARLTDAAKYHYGNSSDILQALTDDLDVQAAESQGMNIEDFRSRENDRRDAETYRTQQQRAAEEKDKNNGIVQQWQRDAEEAKYIYPDFDFKSALQNEAFRQALLDGKSVLRAYKDTLYTEPEPTPEPPPQPKRKAIIQNAQTAHAASDKPQSNPAQLSDKDFRAYIQKIRNS